MPRHGRGLSHPLHFVGIKPPDRLQRSTSSIHLPRAGAVMKRSLAASVVLVVSGAIALPPESWGIVRRPTCESLAKGYDTTVMSGTGRIFRSAPGRIGPIRWSYFGCLDAAPRKVFLGSDTEPDLAGGRWTWLYDFRLSGRYEANAGGVETRSGSRKFRRSSIQVVDLATGRRVLNLDPAAPGRSPTSGPRFVGVEELSLNPLGMVAWIADTTIGPPESSRLVARSVHYHNRRGSHIVDSGLDINPSLAIGRQFVFWYRGGVRKSAPLS